VVSSHQGGIPLYTNRTAKGQKACSFDVTFRTMWWLKGIVARDFTALVFSSKVSILGPDSYPKFCSNLVSISQSYLNLKFDSPLHYAAGSQKKIVSWESFNT
jgi:hypothetical protein